MTTDGWEATQLPLLDNDKVFLSIALYILFLSEIKIVPQSLLSLIVVVLM